MLTALLAMLPAAAQQAQPIALDDIIERLQANLDSYEHNIPSFLCDEHLDSKVHEFVDRGASAGNYETIAESVFRLKRNQHDNHTVTLDESREIRTIDGRPADGHDLDGPAMLSGAFSGGLAVVSRDESVCMAYKLDPVKPRKPIVVRFSSLPAAQRPPDCILREDGSGRAVIDPASMEITRLEIEVPRHVMIPTDPNGKPLAPVVGRWEIQVDYARVLLGARTFWLPSTIASSNSADNMEWSFKATYRNYHKLEVTSRIVLPDDPTKP